MRRALHSVITFEDAIQLATLKAEAAVARLVQEVEIIKLEGRIPGGCGGINSALRDRLRDLELARRARTMLDHAATGGALIVDSAATIWILDVLEAAAKNAEKSAATLAGSISGRERPELVDLERLEARQLREAATLIRNRF